jgi:tetratricopeptide (TPR) repeat protein
MNTFEDNDRKKINTYIDVGKANFGQKRFHEAIDNFNQALNLDHDFTYLKSHDTYYFLGESYRQLNQFNEAIKYLGEALALFDTGASQIDIWVIYLALARALREASNQDATKWMPYYYKIIEILAPKAKNKWLFWQKAEPIFEPVPEAMLEAYYYIGLYHLFKEEYDNAIYSLTKAIDSGSRKQPEFVQAYFYLGRSYLRNNNNQQAIKIYQQLIKINPKFQWVDEASIYYDIGQALYKLGKYEQAMEYGLKVLVLNRVEVDLLAETHLGLGHTYFALESFEKAIEHYQNCIKLTSPKSSIRRTAVEYMVNANEALTEKDSTR